MHVVRLESWCQECTLTACFLDLSLFVQKNPLSIAIDGNRKAWLWIVYLTGIGITKQLHNNELAVLVPINTHTVAMTMLYFHQTLTPELIITEEHAQATHLGLAPAQAAVNPVGHCRHRWLSCYLKKLYILWFQIHTAFLEVNRARIGKGDHHH